MCDEQHGFEADKSVRKSQSPGALEVQIWLLLVVGVAPEEPSRRLHNIAFLGAGGRHQEPDVVFGFWGPCR